MTDFLYYLAVLLTVHWGGAVSLFLITGRHFRTSLPEREIFTHRYHLVGLGFLVSAAVVFTLAPWSPELLFTLGTILMCADAVLLTKAIKATA